MFLRFYCSTELEEYADEFRNTQRQKELYQRSARRRESRLDTFITLWEDYLLYDDEDLQKVLLGKQSNSLKLSDEQAMKIIYRTLCEERVIDSSELNIRSYITGGAPLVDMLVSEFKHSVAHGGYVIAPSLDELKNIQKTRSASYSSLAVHEFREVIVGVSSDEEIAAAKQYLTQRHREEAYGNNYDVLSLSVHYIKIPTDKYNLIPDSPRTYSDRVVISEADRDGVQIPARFVLGGSNWSLSIRFDIDTKILDDGTVQYHLHNTVAQSSLMELLNAGLPTLVGYQIWPCIASLVNYFKRLTDIELVLPQSSVDIRALCVLAGYHSKYLSKFNINLQLTGGIIHETQDNADQRWSLPLESLPRAFKIFLIGDGRCMLNAFVLLSAATLRFMFPDPDAICLLANKSQSTICRYFTVVIKNLTGRAVLDMSAYCRAQDRKALACSIRQLESFELCDTQPDKNLLQFVSIMPQWSSVTFGGARYLHSVRFYALKQVDVLHRSGSKYLHFDFWKEAAHDDIKVKSVTYCQNINDDFPTAGSGKPYLVPDPGVKFPVAKFNPCFVTNSDISRAAREQGRDSRYVVLEWLRLEPLESILTLMRRASESIPLANRFRFPCLSRYEDVKASYTFRAADVPPIVCEWAESKIMRKVNRVAEEAEADNLEAKCMASIARKRLRAVEDFESGACLKRARIEQSLPEKDLEMSEAQVEKRKIANKKARERQRARKRASRAGATVDGSTRGDCRSEGSDNHYEAFEVSFTNYTSDHSSRDVFYKAVVANVEDNKN